MSDNSTPDLGALYRSARERINKLVSDDIADLPVPATPLWTMHDVVAHLGGVARDAATGNMAGAPSDAWTAAQVARGVGRSIDEILTEWATHAAGLEPLLSADGGSAAATGVLDIHTHEADLLNALGLPVRLPADFLTWASATMRGMLHDQVAKAGLAPVTVDASDMEVFRGRLGRRTEDEVAAFGWSADPGPYLDLFYIFGRAQHTLGE